MFDGAVDVHRLLWKTSHFHVLTRFQRRNESGTFSASGFTITEAVEGLQLRKERIPHKGRSLLFTNTKWVIHPRYSTSARAHAHAHAQLP